MLAQLLIGWTLLLLTEMYSYAHANRSSATHNPAFIQDEMSCYIMIPFTHLNLSNLCAMQPWNAVSYPFPWVHEGYAAQSRVTVHKAIISSNGLRVAKDCIRHTNRLIALLRSRPESDCQAQYRSTVELYDRLNDMKGGRTLGRPFNPRLVRGCWRY